MIVRLRPLAAAEAREARAWYEERQAGLGEDFERELRATLDRIQHTPTALPLVDGSVDIRRTLLARFPYGVFFLLQDENHHRHRRCPFATPAGVLERADIARHSP